jgi:murein L,D-transpeptidase YcbB/YkuD
MEAERFSNWDQMPPVHVNCQTWLEFYVRTLAIAISVSVLSLFPAACSKSTPSTQGSGASLAEAHWSASAKRALQERIDRRAQHGLDQLPFPASTDQDEAAALIDRALRYARALARGAADPAKLHEIYTVPRPSADLHAELAKALADDKLGEWLDGLAPRDPQYARLSTAYLALRKGDAKAAAAIPERGEPIDPGSSDPRVPAIARQLVELGYLEGPAPGGQSYAPALVAAVRHMQADYGIKPDGIVGGDALEILNLSDADRARAIAVAMERLRWLERTPPATRIDVNIATARLDYWRDGKIVDSRKVVVGEPDTETPQLQSPIYRLVANPTWTVPRSIQRKEIAGKGDGYLRRNNMVWKDGWIVQQPGPKNSLGLVKFDMKNDHDIYLHDTPAKTLFSEVQRQRSHGCVRVEDALSFAELIARDAGILDAWRKARAAGDQGFVTLPKEIPVRLLYQRVLMDEGGSPIFRSDSYGWDDRVAKALGFRSEAAHRVRSGSEDVGP